MKYVTKIFESLREGRRSNHIRIGNFETRARFLVETAYTLLSIYTCMFNYSQYMH
jgi:hypothetical protein